MCCEDKRSYGSAYNLVIRACPKRFGAVTMVDFTGQLCWLRAGLRSVLSLAATHLVKHVTTDSCVAGLPVTSLFSVYLFQHLPVCRPCL